MYIPRGLFGSQWAFLSKKSVNPPFSPHALWTRGSSLPPRRAYSSTTPGNDAPSKGLVKHIGAEKATIRLPITKRNQHHRDIDVHFIQLRDACQCPRCVDPQTKQRFFRTSEIQADITPEQMRWVDDSNNNQILEIHWANGKNENDADKPHVTRLTADEIKYPAAHFFQTSVASAKPRQLWTRDEMTQAQHWITYKEFMGNDANLTAALDHLSLYGLLFVDDIPQDSRESVARIATRMGPLRNTFYGSTWDVRHDPSAQNVAYTNQNLDFHMDLLYVQNPPGFQLLHCLRNSCAGGESLFVDGFAAAMDLDDEAWRTLEDFEVPYHYNHSHQYYRMERPVLETKKNGKGSEEGARALEYVNYSPPFQGPFNLSGSDGSPTGRDWTGRAKGFISAMRQFEDRIQDPARIFELKLKPGQCVIFENRRVLHARRAFDMAAGERWLAGAYVDEDAMRSRIFTLKRNGGSFNE